jgi:metal-responsive CopG/Arc/MetJ family transcriptional regulator
MNTRKVTIAIPVDLVNLIDEVSKKRGISRSQYISSVLREKMRDEKGKQLKEAYDRVFSDESVRKEQLETAL